MTDLDPLTPPARPRLAPRARQPEVDTRTDAALVAAAVEGDGAAFGVFYTRHVSRLVAYFRPRSGSAQDAYDLVSETFAQALQSLDDFDPTRGEPGGWLMGIAKNKFRRYARQGAVETRGRQRIEMTIGRRSVDELLEIDQSIDLAAIRRELEPAIDRLPAKLAQAVRLRCLDEHTYEHIAVELGARQSTIRKRVSRGLRRLEDMVGDNPFVTHE